MHTYDVVALGELLIDFTTNGTSAQGNPVLEANPGGAPCNVLALLAKMGRSVGFIGKVGQDAFGSQLEAALQETGISTEGLKKDPKIHTTLAVIQTMADGDRDFSFYRNPGADMMLTADELDADIVQHLKHYSVIFTQEISSLIEIYQNYITSGAVLYVGKKQHVHSFVPENFYGRKVIQHMQQQKKQKKEQFRC